MNFFPPNNKLTIRKKGKTPTKILEREEVPFEEFTDAELYASKGGILVFDIECYYNYFLIAFRCFFTKRVIYFEIGTDVEYNVPKLLWVMHNFCIVGFNSNYYDMPLAWLSMKQGVTTETLKNVTNFIIQDNWRPRDVENAYNFKIGQINHIDIIEVAPLSASLKTYSGRLHAERLQDLPYPPEKILTFDEINKTRNYCINDLISTALLLEELSPQLTLRYSMSVQYDKDLRSKSDAQLAETVITGEIQKLSGEWPKRPNIDPGTVYKYQVPSFVQYKTPLLQKMLEIVRNADFVIAESGQVVEPLEFEQLKAVQIGSSIYRMGIGGLHSTEESVSHVADENTLLIDRDVASYYPNIILTQGLYPKHLGEDFLTVYRTIVERRLAAKARVGQLKKEIKELEKALTEFS